jgi:hypothetical protein
MLDEFPSHEVGSYANGRLAEPSPKNNPSYAGLNIFGDVFERLRNESRSAEKDRALIQAALNGMLKSSPSRVGRRVRT